MGTWISLADALREGYDKASDALAWLTWSQDATLALQQGKALPPSPSAPSIFKERLETEQARISALTIPGFDAALPNDGPVPTTSFDATREAIRARMGDLTTCVGELAASRNAIGYFKQLENALAMQDEMLRQLAAVLLELAATYPVPFLADQLLFTSVDIEGPYMQIVQETRDKLKNKILATQAARAARIAVIKAAASEVQNVLVVEAIDLKAQVQRIQDMDNEVVVFQEKVIRAVDARDKALADEKRGRSLLDAATLDVIETEGRLDAARKEVDRLNGQIYQLTAAINVEYKCPDSGVSWNECDNPQHGQYKADYIKRRNEMGAQLGQVRNAHDNATKIVTSIAEDLENAIRQSAAFADELAAAQVRTKEAVARLETAKTKLAKKARIAEDEKWKSRADLFFAENSRDQQQVTTSIRQLGEGE